MFIPAIVRIKLNKIHFVQRNLGCELVDLIVRTN